VTEMSKSVQRSQEGRYHRGLNEAELIEEGLIAERRGQYLHFLKGQIFIDVIFAKIFEFEKSTPGIFINVNSSCPQCRKLPSNCCFLTASQHCI